MKKLKTHYSLSGEWGGQKVCNGRYFSSNVALTNNVNNVTCKFCIKKISQNNRKQ